MNVSHLQYNEFPTSEDPPQPFFENFRKFPKMTDFRKFPKKMKSLKNLHFNNSVGTFYFLDDSKAIPRQVSEIRVDYYNISAFVFFVFSEISEYFRKFPKIVQCSAHALNLS